MNLEIKQALSLHQQGKLNEAEKLISSFFSLTIVSKTILLLYLFIKISNSEITPYKDYINRRKFIKNCGITALLSSLSPNSFAQHELGENSYNHLLSNADSLNTFEEITTFDMPLEII